MTLAYRQSPDLLARRIAGETIVVPIRGKLADMQRIFALNEVGEFVWHQIDGRRTVAEIGDAVSAEFDIERAQAEADMQAFLEELRTAELIEAIP